MLVLALDAALDRCAAALVADDVIRAERLLPGGEASALPALVRDLLAMAGASVASLDMVACTVGPGSFTGIRAALALAHGVGDAAGRRVVGVTVGEAIAPALPHLGARTLWVLTESRRGRLFLERAPGTDAATIEACDASAIPSPSGPVAIAGPAAAAAAATLAARDAPVMLTDARHPLPRHVALAAAARAAGRLPPLAAQPRYVDPPEARLPALLRPPPC